MKRASGVLMHVSSLPGDYSIGSFGHEARKWIDFLSESGFTYWQVLPFCMADESHSPYKSYSAFGGNPYLLDLPTLRARGLLTDNELAAAKQNGPYLCEYDRLSRERLPLLRLAAARVSTHDRRAMTAWLQKYPELADAARFLALKDANRDLPWTEWTVSEPRADDLFFWQFVQHEFFTQWQTLKAYANGQGIRIIGDIPIYVAHDSCDVWANRDQFLLNEDGHPTAVAGVPPDYFCREGQLWGNPLYDWNRMKADDYAWWSRRVTYMLTLFDGVRIDHFRGLESFWSVPAAAKSAKEGQWVKGPDRAFIDRLRAIAGDRLIIAEDLGDITPAVEALVAYSGFPGMRVLQFGFLGDHNSPHLPHNYPKNCVAYTGTHDNNTLLGYVWEMSADARREMLDYCNGDHDDWDRGCEQIVKTVMASHADTVIFPIQDLLVYGADTRMNTPGTATDNWQYRVTREQLAALPTEKLHYLNRLYGRV